MDKVCVVMTTYESEEKAADAAKNTVEKGLSACATFFKVRSIYKWKGKTEDATEYLVIYKTLATKAEQLKSEVLKTHSYEVPELLEINVDGVGEGYLKWILETLT
ncbi:MAG: divalent-cation tolerance protein CutA [Thaumarchaeota archaeon]|nr:divalent-cation tolerance protein CutA [Nitrososphaerota archaeon]